MGVDFKPLILNFVWFKEGLDRSMLCFYTSFSLVILQFFVQTKCILEFSVSKDSIVVALIW